MILTDREIQTAIRKKIIVIEPNPEEKAYSSTSVDLTLDPILSIFKEPKHGMSQAFDPSVEKFNAEDILKELTDRVDISKDGYNLQ